MLTILSRSEATARPSFSPLPESVQSARSSGMTARIRSGHCFRFHFDDDPTPNRIHFADGCPLNCGSRVGSLVYRLNPRLTAARPFRRGLSSGLAPAWHSQFELPFSEPAAADMVRYKLPPFECSRLWYGMRTQAAADRRWAPARSSSNFEPDIPNKLSPGDRRPVLRPENALRPIRASRLQIQNPGRGCPS